MCNCLVCRYHRKEISKEKYIKILKFRYYIYKILALFNDRTFRLLKDECATLLFDAYTSKQEN